MDETFIININCSNILFDSPDTRYKMYIDTTKISIVYELMEWIRWIFSVEDCIYLTHDNSVIHELENIRVLFKLKDFEIKRCGRQHCVHKKTYRNLLNNLNLFVNWNEMKVHKYFLEKLNQIDEKLVQKKNRIVDNIKLTNTENSTIVMEREQVENSKKRISNEKPCDIQLLSSNPNTDPFHSKRPLIDESKSEPAPVCDSSFEMNYFDNKQNTEENLLIHFENSSNGFNNSFNSLHTNVTFNKKNGGGNNFISSHIESKLETKDPDSKNCPRLNLNKNTKKCVKPFSLGEILSNLREDLEKQNSGNVLKKNTLSSSSRGGNFKNKITSYEKFIANKTIKGKKRQRTRKRKKSKKQEVGNENLILPILEGNGFTQKFEISNANNKLTKPNHIRFDVEDEVHLMETDLVQDELGAKYKNEGETNQNNELVTFVKVETKALIDDCQNFSKAMVGPLENEVENQAIEDEDKVTDLVGDVCVDNLHSYSANENVESIVFCQDLNMVQSLKEKLKNGIVVNRFY